MEEEYVYHMSLLNGMRYTNGEDPYYTIWSVTITESIEFMDEWEPTDRLLWDCPAKIHYRDEVET